MTGFDVDLFVIGAGSGGVRAARIAAGHGAKVIVAEDFRVGGTCVIRGCVPKKLMVYASRFADDFADAAGFGWTVPPVNFDWSTLVRAKETEITRLSGLYSANLERAGVEVVAQRAEIEDANTVRLADGRRIRAKYILVAVGGSPTLAPTIPGLEHGITSNEIFDVAEQPKRMLVVGSGYIGVEFASIFTRLGTEVTLCMRGETILRGFDTDLRENLTEALTTAGITIRPAALPTRIEKTEAGLEVTLTAGEMVTVDAVLVATGRRPHTKGLGLERAGVKLDAKGAICVDALSQTNVASIYAVGDVTDRVALTPVAIREGHAFADTVFGGKRTAVVHVNIPTAVFTTPELGTVGLTEAEACAIYDCVDVYSARFKPMRATLSGRAERVLMKIIVDGVTDKVLGVHILGEAAGEMAQLLGVIVQLGACKADFDATMAVHPTAAEELVTMRVRSVRHERAALEPAGPGAAVDA